MLLLISMIYGGISSLEEHGYMQFMKPDPLSQTATQWQAEQHVQDFKLNSCIRTTAQYVRSQQGLSLFIVLILFVMTYRRATLLSDRVDRLERELAALRQSSGVESGLPEHRV